MLRDKSWTLEGGGILQMPAPNDRQQYFTEIGVPEPIVLRVNHLLDFCTNLLGKSPDSFLLENGATPEGAVNFSNVACFADDRYLDMPVPEPNWHIGVISIKTIFSLQ